jgi:peptide-methionine (S)-S-oxide reductase
MGMIMTSQAQTQVDKQAIAIFAGGCFWCEEEVYDHEPGVISAVSGFTGGHTQNPTYEEVSAGGTGHLESVQVTFDPSKVSYEKLLDLFWRNIDPFDAQGQFCDKGDSYHAAIFYSSPEQKKAAEASKKAVEAKLGKPVVTKILPAGTFYPAEDYHQRYAEKNPIRYKFYRYSCGRDKRLKEVWGASEDR